MENQHFQEKLSNILSWLLINFKTETRDCLKLSQYITLFQNKQTKIIIIISVHPNHRRRQSDCAH
jgi:hypothetical protein